jgi:valyl-tRNA synthetase
MLHPYIPFATEEIYSYVPFVHGGLVTSEFPLPEEAYIDDKVEHDAEFVFGVIRGMRSLKTELGIPIVKELKAYFTSLDEHEKELLNMEKEKIMKIAKVSTLEDVSEKPSRVLKTVVNSTTVYLELPFDVDMAKERERFEKTLKEIENELKSINSRLLNRAFLEKASPEVIKKDRDRLEELEKTKVALLSHIEDLGK